MTRRGARIAAVYATLAVLLGACAQAELVTHAAKEIARITTPSDNLGTYKVGDPYQIQGVWYYPAEDPEYSEVGNRLVVRRGVPRQTHGQRRDLRHERADRGAPHPADADRGAGDQHR